MKKDSSFVMKFLVVATYIIMVLVNFLANSLPLNNRSTGVISDAYPNLFAPAGITFSIWGLIYLLLLFYTIYQFKALSSNISVEKKDFLNKINLLFIASSLANIDWIFAWHYDLIAFSVVIMTVILITLIKIADLVRLRSLTKLEKFFIALPFSVYFGWITVAAIANVSVFLVSLNWNGFGLAESIWTVIILLVGAGIVIARSLKDKQIAYPLVLIWAYSGILIKHISPDYFAAKYQNVIIATVICIISFIVTIGFVYKRNRIKEIA